YQPKKIKTENLEQIVKNYFLYPHLCGVLDTLDEKIALELINGQKSLFHYLSNQQNWDQSTDCKKALEILFRNSESKKLCYNYVLNAAIPYFSSNKWKNFFQLSEQNVTLQF